LAYTKIFSIIGAANFSLICLHLIYGFTIPGIAFSWQLMQALLACALEVKKRSGENTTMAKTQLRVFIMSSIDQ
jgi:hypothetical protein